MMNTTTQLSNRIERLSHELELQKERQSLDSQRIDHLWALVAGPLGRSPVTEEQRLEMNQQAPRKSLE